MTVDLLRTSGARHLVTACPVMAELVEQVGPCELPRRRGPYAFLVGAFLSQQVSTKAAATIRGRLLRAAGGHFTPPRLAALAEEDLRACGLSRQKASYVRDLTDRVESGHLRLDRLAKLDDAAVINALTEVRGIGVWSAQMYLMFVLNRPDVLPLDDVGIQNGFQTVYGLRTRPKPRTMERLARKWRPFRTVGCWYLWRSLDAEPS